MSEPTSDQHRFEFDLDRGIRLQAVEKLEASPRLRLAKNIGPPFSGGNSSAACNDFLW
jgi:hypothetical protein